MIEESIQPLDPGKRQISTRAGKYVRQPTGYAAFLPAAFPPADLKIDSVLTERLEQAALALGGLVGSSEILPDEDLFVYMYVRREAVLSSQIEGTQASLVDLLEYEAQREKTQQRIDVREISNYVEALKYGLNRVQILPLSLRLIREIHGQLMEGVRGGEIAKTPGEFRRSQNWVGGPSPETARYVPPPVEAMNRALHEFEQFLHSDELPILIRVGLAHAQFETIHPFQDGNGRVGRLLITFLLGHEKVLRAPLLYLSIFFKRNREEYYDRLQNVRDKGDWESWLLFFLEGVTQVSQEATRTSRQIVQLQGAKRAQVMEQLGRRSANGLKLLDALFRQPYVNVKMVQKETDLSQPASNSLANAMVDAGILKEITGRQTYRIFAFTEYLNLFSERSERG